VVVHFDVDVVDSGDLPLANLPHFGQELTLAEALACLEVVLASASWAALVVTEVNPDHDPDGGRLVTVWWPHALTETPSWRRCE
jgi:arginase